jgi:hypothetical protein
MTDNKKKKKIGYWDNERFNQEFLKHKADYAYAELHGMELPRFPEYLGKCFIDLSYGLADRPNFRNYTYIDDMISDGIERCLSGWKNFDPNINANSYGYFTVAVWYAFLQRIAKGNLDHKRKMNYINSIDPSLLYEQGEEAHAEVEYHLNQMKSELYNQIQYEPIDLTKKKRKSRKSKSDFDISEFFL